MAESRGPAQHSVTRSTVVDGLYRAGRINHGPQLVAERGYDAMSVLSPC